MPRPDDIRAAKRKQGEERRIRAMFNELKKTSRYSSKWPMWIGQPGWKSSHYIRLARRWNRPISEIKRIIREGE